MESKICKSCGFSVSDTQKFCQECGAKIEHKTICTECGTELAENAKFCTECGAMANQKNETQKPVKEKGSKKPFVINLIKRSLVLAIAILMLVVAFLPIMVYEVDVYGEDIDIKFSAVDGVILFVNSIYSLDDEDIESDMDELYDEIQDVVSEHREDWKYGEELDVLAPYLKKAINLTYRSDMYDASVSTGLVAILCVAYVVIAILLAVFATLSFIAVFKKQMKSRERISILLLGLQAILALITSYAFNTLYGTSLTMDTVMIEHEYAGVQIMVFVIGCLTLTAFAVIRLFIEEKAKARASTIVKYALSLTFVFALLFSAFAPVVRTEIKAAFDGGETRKASSTMGGSIFFALELSERARDELDNTNETEVIEDIKSNVEYLELYTKREYEKGKAEAINQMIYSGIFLGFGAYKLSGLFAFGGIAIVLVFACACILIWQYGLEIATGKRACKAVAITAKVIAIMMAFIALVLTIVTIVVINNNAKEIGVSYTAQISAGPILMLLFAIAVACVPSVKIKGEGIKEYKQNEEI